MAKNFQSNVMPPGSVIADGSGNGYLLTVNSDGSINVDGVNVSNSSVCDGVTNTTKATVAQFHNADNQAIGSGNGLCVGGITQVINSATGNLDRARAAGFDNVPATGIPADLTFTAMAFQCKSTTAVGSAGSATVTLSGATNLQGTNHGVPWLIQVGSELWYDYGGANQEKILVTAVNAATPSITATFANTHSANVVVVGYTYNQARDAAGECDGASGSGTTIAAEYEFNGGGPGGANNYDRARNLTAKGLTTATISSGSSQGSTSFTLSTAPNTSGPGSLQPGIAIFCYTNATGYGTGTSSSQWEMAYVSLLYVPGSTTVPIVCGTLASPGQVNNVTYDRIAWDSYAALGPLTSGFLPTGIGVECDALLNVYDNKMYIPRCAPGNPGTIQVSCDNAKSTYRTGAITQTLYSTAAAVLIEVVGSSTKTVRVKYIKIWAQAGTKFYAELTYGRETAASGGSANNPANTLKLDTNDATKSATINYYTAAAASGTGWAPAGSAWLGISPPAAGMGIQPCSIDFCQHSDKAFVLRGTSDILAIYNNTTGLGTGTYGFEVEWEEDNS
jgi:hypothetical protein